MREEEKVGCFLTIAHIIAIAVLIVAYLIFNR